MSPTSAETTSSRRQRPLAKKPWFWALLSLVAILVVLGAMFTSVVPMSSDVLRHRIIATLSDRLDSDVQLGDLSIRVFPGLRADGKDLRIRRRGTPADLPPLISIKSFHVDASLMGLWRKHVEHVQLDGLEISIPPKQVRVQQKEAERAADAADPAKINKPEADAGGKAPGSAEGWRCRARPRRHRRRASGHHPGQAGQSAEGLGDPSPADARPRLHHLVAVQGDAHQWRAAG